MHNVDIPENEHGILPPDNDCIQNLSVPAVFVAAVQDIHTMKPAFSLHIIAPWHSRLKTFCISAAPTWSLS